MTADDGTHPGTRPDQQICQGSARTCRVLQSCLDPAYNHTRVVEFHLFPPIKLIGAVSINCWRSHSSQRRPISYFRAEGYLFGALFKETIDQKWPNTDRGGGRGQPGLGGSGGSGARRDSELLLSEGVCLLLGLIVAARATPRCSATGPPGLRLRWSDSRWPLANESLIS